MFHKADGSSVWLRSSGKLPYLSVTGVIDTPEDYTAVRPRLCQAYDPIRGIAVDDAFLVRELDEGALIFCAGPDKSCALLVVGRYAPPERKPDAVVETFFDLIHDSVAAISSQAKANIRLISIQPETAIRAN